MRDEPRARRRAADLPRAAGWLPGRAAELRQLREATAPQARPLTVTAGPLTAVDDNADAARGIAAGCIAWYLSAMGEVYARSVSGQGYAAQVEAVIAANPRPSPRRATVPASAQVLLDQLAAYGTGDQVREQLRPWDQAADIVTISLPPGLPWHTIEATLRAAAPCTRPEMRPAGLSASTAGQAEDGAFQEPRADGEVSGPTAGRPRAGGRGCGRAAPCRPAGSRS